MKEFWNEKFNTKEYIYGKSPNVYLAEKLKELPSGKILFVAEGEGRNAVFAAKNNWQVEAFDISNIAKEKALQYAEESNVEINYSTQDFLEIVYDENSFDAIALIYAHVEKSKRASYFKKIDRLLKTGGFLIAEGFGQDHPNYQKKYPNIGGPKNAELLFSVEEFKESFINYDFLELQEVETSLNEGEKHVGKGSVVRMFAKKKL